jgi:uncharacterized membrane protein (UPF0127 family)
MLFISLFIIILLLLSIYYRYEYFQGNKKYIKLIGTVDTPESRAKGLMFRAEPLPENSGLLFDYGGKAVKDAFWMKNTHIPLDIIFIDQNKKVVGLLENMKPFDLTNRTINSEYYGAIEMNAGEIKKMNIQIGNIIVYN